MITSARIAELEGQLLAAQGQAQENYRQLTAANGTIATLTTERDEARTNLATVTGERDTARGELTTERESRETAISTQVTQRLAAAGIDPIKRDPKAIVDTPEGGKAAGTARERLAASFNQQIQK